MPIGDTSKAMLAAALAIASPALASDQARDKAPSAEQDGGPSTEKVDPTIPPAFHAPGPDVGMRNPPPGGRRSPEWNPPATPVPGKQVSPK